MNASDPLLQFAHALVTLNSALLIVVALHFAERLEHRPGAWAGFVGGMPAVAGALALAAAFAPCGVRMIRRYRHGSAAGE